MTRKTLNIPKLQFHVHGMQLQQYKCLAFRRIIDYLDKHCLPVETRLPKHTLAEADQFMIHPNGLVYHICQPRTKRLPNCQRLTLQFVMPARYRLDVLLVFHNQMCHQSPESVLTIIRD